ncbi:MAG: AMP-binding protein, partial [bacterium]|nr:AMP-binding protein [bacterium]
DIAADNFEGLDGNVKGFGTGGQWAPKEEPVLPAKEEEVNGADGLYQLYERPMLSNVYEAPATEMERFLTRTWETFFGIRPIGVTDELFDLGGDSLKAVNLFAIIQEELHVSIPLIQFFDRPTIRQLALFLDDAVEKTPHPVVNTLEPVEEKEYYSLSPAQMRLYILYRLEPGGMSYNIPMTLTLEGELNARRLEESFVHLVRRHESFRTSFLQVNEEPCQRVHAAEEVDFKVEYYDLDSAANRENENERDIIRAFRRPFDLLCPPLFRVGLIKIAERKHILVLDVHHIVADGLSIHLLIGEFYVLYDGLTLPGLKLRYRDFCDWLDRGTKATQGDRETFWLERFRGDIPVLELPYDFPRPPVQRFEGGVTWFELSPGLSAKLKELASREGVTLFIAMLAIFNIVLSGLSGQRDIVVGTPVAGRRHPDLQTVVGMFVNTLALRNHPEPDMTFREFLKPVKQHTLESFDHQEYPFEDLVDRVTVNRDVSRNPLFDVMLAQDNMESAGQYSGEEPEEQEDAVETGSLEAVYYPFEANISRFDLSFHMSDAADGLSISIEYATALFKKETVQRFFNYTRKIIREVTERPGILLKHIDILEENEKQEILDMSQGKEEDIPTHESIHGLFETQAAQYPDRVALVRKGEGAVSYKELDRRADQLAGVLRENGVGNGTIVAVMVERSVGLIVSLLAVLKAGAVCLPIDSEDPEERVDYMLRDSGANVSVRWLNGLMVRRLDGFSEPTDKPTNLSYILYPSGSTSKPKAVILEHRNLLNLLYYQTRHTNIDFSRVLQFAAVGFHVSFQEIFSTLLFGGELTLTSPEILADIPR